MGRLHATYGYWNTFAGMTYGHALMDLRTRLNDPNGDKFSDKQLMQAVLHSSQTMYSRLVPVIGTTWLSKQKDYDSHSSATITKPADCGAVISLMVGSDKTDASTMYQARAWPIEKKGALTQSVSQVPSATRPYFIEERDFITLYPTPSSDDVILFYIARPPWASRYYRGVSDDNASSDYQFKDQGVTNKVADYWIGCVIEALSGGLEGQRIVVTDNDATVEFDGTDTYDQFTATPSGSSVAEIEYVISDPLPLPAEYHPLIMIDAFISLMRAQPGGGDPEKMQSAIDTLEEQMNERFKEFVLAYDVAPESP